MYGTKEKGPRYLEMAEGYVTEIGLDSDSEIIGYKFVQLGVMMDNIAKGTDAAQCAGQSNRNVRPLCRSR